MLQICYKFPCRKKIHYVVFYMLFDLIYLCFLSLKKQYFVFIYYDYLSILVNL